MQGGAWQTDNLPALTDQMDTIQPVCADDDDLAVIIISVRRGTTRQTRIGGLHDDDFAALRTKLGGFPEFDKISRLKNGQNVSKTETVTFAKTVCRVGLRENVASAHDRAKRVEESRVIAGRGRHVWNVPYATGRPVELTTGLSGRVEFRGKHLSKGKATKQASATRIVHASGQRRMSRLREDYGRYLIRPNSRSISLRVSFNQVGRP